MKLDEVFIKKILLSGSYVSEDDIKTAEEFSKTHRIGLVDYLLTEGLINKETLGQAIAESMKVPFADLGSNPPSKEQVLLIPEELAKKFRAVVFSVKKTSVMVCTDDPAQANLLLELSKLFTDRKVLIAFSLPEDINVILTSYQKNLETRFSKIIESGARIAPEILDTIFVDAIDLHASDIHFEPGADDVLLRFRIDGVLRDAGHIPTEYYENILNRIKVQSGIRLDEHYSAQDGAMQFRKESVVVDLRTSIVPTVEGEKVVLRILGSYVQGLQLSELGLSEANQEKINNSADKPFGMILVAGPTGSGKTTTLYALLKLLNDSGINITTIEDPVEYKMRGVNQIQVNAATNLSFAKGLRSIVRQDPDIILVGEIRDEETAEISVNAALTGHLLLSTFHANDAATVIPRLLDMGIEPFLLASTLELVVAQRLVRRICTHCRASIIKSSKEIIGKRVELKKFFTEDEYTLYEGKGCTVCANSGYHGRTAIFEIINITPEMEELILKNPATQEIWKLAMEQGAKTLFEDGIEKVMSGETTMEELLRVAEPNK
ncbi:MAG: GspE/PulE family protein [Candidatus Falkowbacteria bacterium]|nr:GspE/PulE family protein [Candidatus Falkowbacteria bacterium]